tara:strand:+ start:49 stop:801 length:753 start_codon:yes stop_codon:yes gene_type:complete
MKTQNFYNELFVLKLKRAVLLKVSLVVLALFTACAGQSVRAINPASAIVPESLYSKKPSPVEGAIWPGDNDDNMLYTDAKAHRVGEIVTITVEENASSTQTATTETGRNSTVNLNTGRLLGLPGNLGVQNFLGMGNGLNLGLDATTSKTHAGDGTTTRGGQLSTTITAKIIEELPGRQFRIEGRRSVTINNEEQIMVLSGVVRYQDIGFDNTISSTLIADASITYTGQGVIADEQRVGWGSRLISWVWPF